MKLVDMMPGPGHKRSNACFLVLLILVDYGVAIHTQTSYPVVWRETPDSIVDGMYDHQIRLEIQNLSPCAWLTPKVVHSDGLPEAIQRCNERFQDLMDLFEDIAEEQAKEFDSSWIQRIKRFIVESLVLLCVVGVANLGMAIGSLVWLNKVDNTVEEQGAEIKSIEDGLEDMRVKHNQLVKQLGQDMERVNAHLDKAVAQMYTISRIVAKIEIGIQVMGQVKLDWKNRMMSPALIHYMNLTLGCEPECDKDRATLTDLTYDKESKTLVMYGKMPRVRPEFRLYKAEAASLIHRSGGYTCVSEYVGKRFAFRSLNHSCSFLADSINEHLPGVVILPPHVCQNGVETNKQTYGPRVCTPTTPDDVNQYQRVMTNGNTFLVYCPYSKVTVQNTTMECPSDAAFLIERDVHFNVTNFTNRLGALKVDVHRLTDRDASLQINAPFHRVHNYTELLVAPPSLLHSVFFEASSHPVLWAVVGAVFLFSLFSVIALICGCCLYKRL